MLVGAQNGLGFGSVSGRGPIVGVPAFTPPTPPYDAVGLRHWFNGAEASSLTVQDGRVMRWRDLVTGQYAVAPSYDQAPLLDSFSGRPAPFFDTTRQCHLSADFMADALKGNLAVFTVFRSADVSDHRFVLGASGVGGYDLLSGLLSGGTAYLERSAPGNGKGSAFGIYDLPGPYVALDSFNLSSTQMFRYMDYRSDTQFHSGGPLALDTVWIGGDSRAGVPNWGFYGHIGEILVYDVWKPFTNAAGSTGNQLKNLWGAIY